MKHLAIALISALISFITQAQDSTSTYTAEIKIANILNTKGYILIGLHNQDTFMKGKGIKNAKLKIEGDTVLATFNNLKPGIYAVMVLHDENDNNRMDFDSSGMPTESYGMSNNPMLFGPPTFTDAKFEMKDNIKLTIRF